MSSSATNAARANGCNPHAIPYPLRSCLTTCTHSLLRSLAYAQTFRFIPIFLYLYVGVRTTFWRWGPQPGSWRGLIAWHIAWHIGSLAWHIAHHGCTLCKKLRPQNCNSPKLGGVLHGGGGACGAPALWDRIEGPRREIIMYERPPAAAPVPLSSSGSHASNVAAARLERDHNVTRVEKGLSLAEPHVRQHLSYTPEPLPCPAWETNALRTGAGSEEL